MQERQNADKETCRDCAAQLAERWSLAGELTVFFAQPQPMGDHYTNTVLVKFRESTAAAPRSGLHNGKFTFKGTSSPTNHFRTDG